jgi:hypothetical protein
MGFEPDLLEHKCLWIMLLLTLYILQREGIICNLAAVVSTIAMRHQYWVQHEQLPMVFCQSEDVINVI